MRIRRHLLPALAASLAVAAPAALAALPGGAKYAGTTSDGKAVTLRLTGDGTRVKRMRIVYSVACDNGGAATTYTDILGAKIHKNHGFSASGTYTGSTDGSKNTFHVSGTVWTKTAHGKFSLKATGKASDGSKLTCKTDKLTWSVKRQK
jgi:hypothetical protein